MVLRNDFAPNSQRRFRRLQWKQVPVKSSLAQLLLLASSASAEHSPTEEAGFTVGNHIPVEMPSDSWPALSAAASNAAWPSGRQPARLSAWPQTGGGTKEPVYHTCWKTRILADVAKGWPDMCTNLFRANSRNTPSLCEATCVEDARCSVWQFLDVSGSGMECWLGSGTYCTQLPTPDLSFKVLGGQRIQHGDVLVMRNMSGPLVRNLYNLGPSATGTEEEQIQRCRNWCYSLIACQYWQFGVTGCWIDSPYLETERGMIPNRVVEYPLTNAGLDSVYQMTRGEYIMHYCPPEERSPAELPSSVPVPAPAGTLAAAREQELALEAQAKASRERQWLTGAILFLVALAAGMVAVGCYMSRKRREEEDDYDMGDSDDPYNAEVSRPLIDDTSSQVEGKPSPGPSIAPSGQHRMPAGGYPYQGHGGYGGYGGYPPAYQSQGSYQPHQYVV
mmetsp:Transcript_47961/g.102693  ORF Transcript_47961/g.102693 Transcript_47961/m.102693 type:complete len:447 (+) Transcript_47961:52-1392(+)